MTDRDVAIAHWAIPGDGGGERVVWQLARIYDAPVYTAHSNPDITPEDIDVHGLFDDRRLLKACTQTNLAQLPRTVKVAKSGWDRKPVHPDCFDPGDYDVE